MGCSSWVGIDASFGAHCTNLNEDRPILSATKMLADDSSFWKYKVHADIRGGSSERGRQTTLGVVDDGNFWRFRWLRLRKLQRYGKQYYMTICCPLSVGNWLQNEWPWVAISCQNPFSARKSWIRAFECQKICNLCDSTVFSALHDQLASLGRHAVADALFLCGSFLFLQPWYNNNNNTQTISNAP